MDIIYKITYIPHLGTNLPKYYIGSKKNWYVNCGYMGSLASTKIFDFTDGMELKEWWKTKTLEETDNFVFEIIEKFEDKPPKELVLIEKNYQEKLGVMGNDYFNQSIATKGFVSTKNTDGTKLKKSMATKKYWDSPEGIEKRKRLSERNKKTKSKELKEKWKDPEFIEKMKGRKKGGRKIGSKNKDGYKKKEMRKIQIDDVIYDNAFDASKMTGIHPVNVRRRCRLEQYTNWRYI